MMLKGFQYKHLYIGLTTCLIIFLFSATLFAGDATLSWDPPTTNADGTPLTDLAGFIIYDGTATGVYSYSTNVGNVTTYQVGNLTEGVTYYFAITAYDTSGNESEYSNEVSKTIALRAIYSISGTVNEPGSRRMPGSSITGVTITLSGAAAVTTTTDASGDYTFSGLSDGSYTVTPGLTGYTFTPASSPVTISGADATGVDFTGTATGGGSYSISGTVLTLARSMPGSPISGVTMTLSGNASGTTTTNSSGNYTFTGLADGSYTVTPGKAGYTFTPTSRSVTISGGSRTGQNFTGTFTGAPTYSISGTVLSGGSPLAGVTMALTGDAGGAATTDGSGNYTFTGLADGSYTVTPGLAGYAFTPASSPVTISGAGVTGVDFTGTATGGGNYSISGTVKTPDSGSPGGPISGVTMTLSGDASGTTTTNSSGNYTFTGLADGNYTVTPGKAGYTFTPTSRAVTISGVNRTGQNFTGN